MRFIRRCADHGAPHNFDSREVLHIGLAPNRLSPCGRRFLEAAMAALAKVLSRATGIEIDVDTLRPILIFCGAGLLFSLLMMSYRLDLNPRLF
jgi:hypothetical protein